jgi:hypothetical protein
VVQKFNAAHTRHAKVGDDRLERRVEFGYCFEAIRSGFDNVPFSTQGRLKSGKHLNIVVNYK